MTIHELSPDETVLAYEAMLELRPHIGTADEFVERVNRVLRPGGYRLVGSFADDARANDPAAAVAGFRVGDTLQWQHFLYVDDLVTSESARSSGHATRLLDWLLEEAGRQRCEQFHLDSGTHRHDAHRRYLGWGLRITGFHFARELT
jgi:GNAT superfamily N-acetyltransferase